MSVSTSIQQKLNEALMPARLEVIDESHLHAGHAGARPEGESHFRVEIVSTRFAGKSRVERQRMVYTLLDNEFANGLHALSLKALTPNEDGEKKGFSTRT